MIIKLLAEIAERSHHGGHENPPFWDLEALLREGHDFVAALEVLAARRSRIEAMPLNQPSAAMPVAQRATDNAADDAPDRFDLNENRLSA